MARSAPAAAAPPSPHRRLASLPRPPFPPPKGPSRAPLPPPRPPTPHASLLLPRRLYEQFGLRCKREIWRVQLALAKIRKSARVLLTLPDKDPRRMFEGAALIRRLTRYGLSLV